MPAAGAGLSLGGWWGCRRTSCCLTRWAIVGQGHAAVKPKLAMAAAAAPPLHSARAVCMEAQSGPGLGARCCAMRRTASLGFRLR